MTGNTQDSVTNISSGGTHGQMQRHQVMTKAGQDKVDKQMLIDMLQVMIDKRQILIKKERKAFDDMMKRKESPPDNYWNKSHYAAEEIKALQRGIKAIRDKE